MRSTYRVFSYLIAAGVLVQAASVTYAWFTVIQSIDDGGVFDKSAGANAGHYTHGIGGMLVIPLVALIFLVLSFFAKIPGGVKWAAITFGLTAAQVGLAVVSFSAPAVGTLHGLNAIALLAAAICAGRRVSAAAPVPVPA